MKALPILLLFMMFRALPVAAEAAILQPPGAVRRGEPAFAVLAPVAAGYNVGDYTMVVRFPDGVSSPVYRGFRVPGSVLAGGRDVVSAGPSARGRVISSVLFFFSVPVDAALGTASMVAYGRDGVAVAGSRLVITDRTFSREDLRLSAELTSLRVDPDPLKTEQALRYLAVLAAVDPAAVFLDSNFIRPVATERRTSLFGLRRRYLYADGKVDVTLHNGIDYGLPAGSPVMAAGAGRVVMAEARIVTGLTVILEHLPGTYTIYMHLDSLAVMQGAIVARGAFLGTVGMTGLATGPHLHWEFRVMGVPCDPEALIGLDKMRSIRRMVHAIEGG
jgi:murein DD-endopeptidase MepM/ murein hydrolase activator NlpD